MRFLKKLRLALLFLWIIVLLASCGTKVTIDYADEAAFENALNEGENLEGKIVQFVASELRPDSKLGYNVCSGEHLNFISPRNPDIKVGDVVVVKVTKIENLLGSWIITYEKVNNAVIGDGTISSATSPESSGPESDIQPSEEPSSADGASLFTPDNTSKAEQPLKVVDYGWYINEPTGDTAYVNFCGIINNPNDNLIAEFPKVLVTVKNGDGSILATEEQTGSCIMPGDTITLCGMFSMPVSDVTEDAKIIFDVDWSDFTKKPSFHSGARTTDFVISNVSERTGNKNYITGEITNNYSEDVDMVNLSMILRQEGKIVFVENTYLDSLKAGKTKAFEFNRYSNWPEHDAIEISAMVW